MRYQQSPPPNPDPDRQPAPRQRRHPDTDANGPLPTGPASPGRRSAARPDAGRSGLPWPPDPAHAGLPASRPAYPDGYASAGPVPGGPAAGAPAPGGVSPAAARPGGTPPGRLSPGGTSAGPGGTPPAAYGPGAAPSGGNGPGGTPPGGFAPGHGRPGRHLHRGRVGVQTPPAGQPAPPHLPPTRRDPVPSGPAAGDEPTGARARAISRAEYNLPKVIAGGGAAATTAVVGSYFGVAGTVVGAALAAIVTSVATTTFQRGLDTTTRTVRTRVVRLRRVDTGTEATAVMPPLPAPRDGGDPDATRAVADADGTIRLGDQDTARSGSRFTPKRIAVTAGIAVLAFVIGLFVVTGIEWIKGSPISGGESGTSVGRVLRPADGAAEPTTTAPPQDPESSGANDGRQDPGTDATQQPSQRNQPDGGGPASRTTSPPTTTGAAPTAPRGGGLLPNLGGSGADG